MLFGSNTPTPEFRGNSRERGPRSPEGTRQGSDPPLGVHRSAPRHTGRGDKSGCSGRRGVLRRRWQLAPCGSGAALAARRVLRAGGGLSPGRRVGAGGTGAGRALAACGRTLGLSRARRAGWANRAGGGVGRGTSQIGAKSGPGRFRQAPRLKPGTAAAQARRVCGRLGSAAKRCRCDAGLCRVMAGYQSSRARFRGRAQRAYKEETPSPGPGLSDESSFSAKTLCFRSGCYFGPAER